MPCLWVVASPFAILPSSTSWFCPLELLLLQKLAPYCMSILPQWSYSSAVTPSRGIALPPCLVSNALDRCNYRRDLTFMVTNVGPQVQWFSLVTAITHPHPRALAALCEPILSFVFRGACGRVWVTLLYLSMNCFLTCIRYYCLRC